MISVRGLFFKERCGHNTRAVWRVWYWLWQKHWAALLLTSHSSVFVKPGTDPEFGHGSKQGKILKAGPIAGVNSSTLCFATKVASHLDVLCILTFYVWLFTEWKYCVANFVRTPDSSTTYTKPNLASNQVRWPDLIRALCLHWLFHLHLWHWPTCTHWASFPFTGGRERFVIDRMPSTKKMCALLKKETTTTRHIAKGLP